MNPIYYRVSVYDDRLGLYVVRHASLKKAKADKLVQQYAAEGLIAQSKPCRPRKKTGRRSWGYKRWI